jgi:hypothetical protein
MEAQGGRYLGICAGAYFAAKEVVFEKGTEMEVTGAREFVSSSLKWCTMPDAVKGLFPWTMPWYDIPTFQLRHGAGRSSDLDQAAVGKISRSPVL